jgi:hypothetical protein
VLLSHLTSLPYCHIQHGYGGDCARERVSLRPTSASSWSVLELATHAHRNPVSSYVECYYTWLLCGFTLSLRGHRLEGTGGAGRTLRERRPCAKKQNYVNSLHMELDCVPDGFIDFQLTILVLIACDNVSPSPALEVGPLSTHAATRTRLTKQSLHIALRRH